jgi:GNAT superfamily N-acetyltransferase
MSLHGESGMNMAIKELSDENHGDACRVGESGDAEAGFVRAVKNRNGNVRCIYSDDEIVGVLQLTSSNNALVYIYVFPQFRKAGIGRNLLGQCEGKVRSDGCKQISTLYRTDFIANRLFAERNGYRRTYSMSYMEYAGTKFAINEQPIREYRLS